MTYNVFGGMLNLALSLSGAGASLVFWQEGKAGCWW